MSSKRSRDTLSNPPIPSEQPDASGQRLLALLKALDKHKDDIEVLQETVDFMQQVIAVVQRRGLLQGNGVIAEQVLTAAAVGNNAAAGNSNIRKNRSGKRGRSINELTMQAGDVLEKSGPSAVLDVQLLTSAIARVLQESSKKDAEGESEKLWILVAVAADLVTAACEYIKSRSLADTCFLAEYELVASMGKNLLVGMEKHIRSLIIQNRDDSEDEDESSYAMAACLRSSASLVSLFGTKLSRSTAILLGLREVAWESMFVATDDLTVQAAMTLLATLPFAGGTDKLTPSLVWNQCFTDAVTALSTAIRKVAPVVGTNKAKKNSDTYLTEDFAMSEIDKQAANDHWLSKIQEASPETIKVRIFLQLVKGLASYIISLLSRDAVSVTSVATYSLQLQLIGIEINVDAILGLIETMLSFSSASEAKYYGTKKRLRLETINGGLLSPAAITGKVAMTIRLYGHELLDATIAALGAAVLLPFARRVMRISQTALLTSSSSALRRVLDPSSAAQLEGKRKRWLHTSITARTAAVKSFQQTLLAFGTDPRGLSSYSTSRRSSNASDVDRAVTLVCGHIVEELTYGSTIGVEWGSMDDRVQLVAASADCLATCLNSGGEFLSIATRGLVDSVASSCMSSVLRTCPISSFGIVKAAILALGVAASCTPWQDGAASSTTKDLKKLARACLQDGDPTVAFTATSALRVSDALDCPRVPALNVVTRSDTFMSSIRPSNIVAADTMVYKLQSARDEIERMNNNEDYQKSEGEANLPKKTKFSHLYSQKPLSPEAVLESAIKETLDVTCPRNKLVEKQSLPVSSNEMLKPIQAFSEERTGTGDDVAASTVEVAAAVLNDAAGLASQEDMDEDYFPMIVDCGPDEDDK